jgi:hypothetical protein
MGAKISTISSEEVRCGVNVQRMIRSSKIRDVLYLALKFPILWRVFLQRTLNFVTSCGYLEAKRAEEKAVKCRQMEK